MAEVTLTIAGRDHKIACRDGEEAQLRALAGKLEAHGAAALRASGGLSGERTMLFIALMLADQLAEQEVAPPSGIPPMLLDRIADRLEAVASALEDDGGTH
ncbi:cell division protein ZapA [Sphingomonas qomolangmaensis]|uniref:Cell division protein ZapA n=1 Tax=Sphingomonas qomolangmaensis TaxID=2918765 RepID=A0ABY5LC84_9SPHN|nr:cell division protein ZapA [Sphingomonas qomolangmaensis]UUL83283.1 cell division protein ZapA [Sphingomonas qomolangmaensis]